MLFRVGEQIRHPREIDQQVAFQSCSWPVYLLANLFQTPSHLHRRTVARHYVAYSQMVSFMVRRFPEQPLPDAQGRCHRLLCPIGLPPFTDLRQETISDRHPNAVIWLAVPLSLQALPLLRRSFQERLALQPSILGNARSAQLCQHDGAKDTKFDVLLPPFD